MFQKTLVWLFISLNAIVFAQKTYQVKGVVLDAKTLQPLAGVNIIGDNLYAISSVTGEFSIDGVLEGTYSFKISHISCKHKNITVKVAPDMPLIKILLDESNNKLDEIQLVGKTKKRRAQS